MGRNGEHLRKVRAEGGRHEAALAAVRPTGRKVGNYGYRPTLLPGGRILMNVEADDGEPRPAIVDLDTGDISVLEIVSPFADLHRKRTSSLHADGRDDDGGPVRREERDRRRSRGGRHQWDEHRWQLGAGSGCLRFRRPRVLDRSCARQHAWTSSRLVRIANGAVSPLPFDAEYVRT